MKRVVAVGLVLLFSGALTGAASLSPAERNPGTIPHVLRVAAGDISTLNPHLGVFADIANISSLTMAYLVKWDSRNEPYPELATAVPSMANGGISKDGLTITYHLRRGVRWSDGAPFSADDVIFSTNAVLDPANNEGHSGWDFITKIDEPDKYTVVYHLKKRFSPFVETFFSTSGTAYCILPKHLLSGYKSISEAPYNQLPVGIGPFKYERWDREQDVVLVANSLYFRGRPKLNSIIFKIIPDRNTMLIQVQAHEIDLWYTVPGTYLTRLEATPGVLVLQRPSYEWYHLDFNLTSPALQDVVVRRALRLAYDRATALHKIQHDAGTLSESPTPPNSPYSVEEQLIPYDPSLANSMLDKDGWKVGPDGVRTKNGVALNLRYAIYSGAPDVDDAIELLRQNWQQIGVAITVKHYPLSMFFAMAKDGGIVYDQAKWDITSFAWKNDALGDYSGTYGCDFPPNGSDVTHWCNREALAAMNAFPSHYDQRQRNADVKQFVEQFVEDVPVIVVNQRVNVYALNSDVKRFDPNAITPFDNFMDVDI